MLNLHIKMKTLLLHLTLITVTVATSKLNDPFTNEIKESDLIDHINAIVETHKRNMETSIQPIVVADPTESRYDDDETNTTTEQVETTTYEHIEDSAITVNVEQNVTNQTHDPLDSKNNVKTVQDVVLDALPPDCLVRYHQILHKLVGVSTEIPKVPGEVNLENGNVPSSNRSHVPNEPDVDEKTSLTGEKTDLKGFYIKVNQSHDSDIYYKLIADEPKTPLFYVPGFAPHTPQGVNLLSKDNVRFYMDHIQHMEKDGSNKPMNDLNKKLEIPLENDGLVPVQPPFYHKNLPIVYNPIRNSNWGDFKFGWRNVPTENFNENVGNIQGDVKNTAEPSVGSSMYPFGSIFQAPFPLFNQIWPYFTAPQTDLPEKFVETEPHVRATTSTNMIQTTEKPTTTSQKSTTTQKPTTELTQTSKPIRVYENSNVKPITKPFDSNIQPGDINDLRVVPLNSNYPEEIEPKPMQHFPHGLLNPAGTTVIDISGYSDVYNAADPAKPLEPPLKPREPLFEQKYKFVLPFNVNENVRAPISDYPERIDPFAYYPTNMQPEFMNVPVPYKPLYHMVKRLWIPNRYM